MNLNIFNTSGLFDAATNLFQQLGIKLNSNTAEALNTKDLLKSYYKENETFHSIKSTYFIGIIDDSVFQATGMFDVNYSIKEALQQGDKNYEGLMLFALELTKKPTRTEISEITRVFNRISQKMPVAMVLKYAIEKEAIISIAISERFKYLQNWRQGEKAGKVIILRDIFTNNTHAGHLRILLDLVKPAGVTNYAQLHAQWLQVLDVNILNKKFFQELASWYFWAMDKVQFPDDIEKKKDVRNATNLIRLITRIIFIWFIKEKHLVSASLFNEKYLEKILKDFNKNKQSGNYYQAILQNLFFGTLNQKMNERDFAEDHNRTNKLDQGIKNKYRYPDKFNISKKEIIDLFKDIPFLNGGLFDCLDKFDEEKLEKGKKEQIFVDGFTRLDSKQAIVPDYLFFGVYPNEDLTEYYDPEAKKPIVKNVKGLIDILNDFKFTVAENTPIEEEIALDPELLGKVFENLLASYNPETKTTARKQTGSFYTPREIVNYMVDESLIEYLKQHTNIHTDNYDSRLRKLFAYEEKENPFNTEETNKLIEAINNCKILDPACGSGAFPMGVLHKMVHLLQKLDPGNVKWKEQQREKIIGNQIKELEKDRKAIAGLSDKAVREKAIQAVDERLKEIDEIFESKNNFDDYARKLYLIENCIYGIDIQPIAVQISKLRFFISLIIDQKVHPSSLMDDKLKGNRGIRPLPNLETKFVAANTLIALEKPIETTGDLFLSEANEKLNQLKEQLKQIRHFYFSASSRKQKIEFQKKDKEYREEISKLLTKEGWKTNVADQIASFDPYDQNHFANWFEPEWMFGNEVKNGFDVVIGNPPYIQLQKNGGTLAKQFENMGFYTFERTGDIYSLFYEKGWQVLKPAGFLIFITSNKWMRAGYGEKTREFFAKRTNPKLLIDFAGVKIFESATVDTNILLYEKNDNQINTQTCTIGNDYKLEMNLSEYLSRNSGTSKFADGNSWTIMNGIEAQIKAKIEAKGIALKDWDINIYRGITTGYNEAFIIDGKKKDELIAQDPKSAEIIKPILRGRDIKRYNAEFADLWLINTHNGYKKNDGTKEKRIDVNNYPAIKKHLENYIDALNIRQDKGETPYNLRNCAYVEEFEKEKIIFTKASKIQAFALDYIGNILQNTSYFISENGSQIKYIIAILNSKIIGYAFKCFYQSGGIDGEITIQAVEVIPIPQISEEEQAPFIELVDIILAKKEKGEDTKIEENKIDQLVYKLYDLTEEEIKIIEGVIK